MDESEKIIKSIKELKRIQPDEEWIALTKSAILDNYSKRLSLIGVLRMFFRYKFFVASASLILSTLVIFGVFEVSERALPGDFLYPVKKIADNARIKFSPENEKPILQMELVNSRLEDLAKVAKKREAKRLPIAYKEVQESASQAVRKLSVDSQKAKIDYNVSKKIVDEAKDIQKNKKIVGQILMTQVETDQFKKLNESLSPYRQVLQNYKRAAGEEIKYWESRTLDNGKKKVLAKAKDLYKNGNYEQALQILLNSQE